MGQSVTLELPDDVFQLAHEIAASSEHAAEDILLEWILGGAAGALVLYTIGHSDLTQQQLVARLQQYGVSILVDVRSVPFSRYNPQFNKNNLSSVLEESGIEYKFAGELLGGRPSDPDAYKNHEQPDADTKRHDYLERVDYKVVMERDWYRKGIYRLIDIIRGAQATNGHVAVMCSEGNPQECHRHHLIARSLVDPSVRVIDADILVRHILKDGTVTSVSLKEFKDAPQQLQMFGDI